MRDPIYRGRRFSAEVIELCVRWHLTYRLSYLPEALEWVWSDYRPNRCRT